MLVPNITPYISIQILQCYLLRHEFHTAIMLQTRPCLIKRAQVIDARVAKDSGKAVSRSYLLEAVLNVEIHHTKKSVEEMLDVKVY